VPGRVPQRTCLGGSHNGCAWDGPGDDALNSTSDNARAATVRLPWRTADAPREAGRQVPLKWTTENTHACCQASCPMKDKGMCLGEQVGQYCRKRTTENTHARSQASCCEQKDRIGPGGQWHSILENRQQQKYVHVVRPPVLWRTEDESERAGGTVPSITWKPWGYWTPFGTAQHSKKH
jgi:hypothetical protein